MFFQANHLTKKVWLAFVLTLFVGCGGGESGGGSTPTVAQANRAPAIVSALETVFPTTRTGVAYTIVGSDPDGDTLTYSISGQDAGAFSVDSRTGEITFLTAPDVDMPGAADSSNFYVIEVEATDPSGASASQRVSIEVSRHDPAAPTLFREGSVFLAPNTIQESDPTALRNVTFLATAVRNIPDNRIMNDVDTEVNIFLADYDGGHQIEILVNTEISTLSEAEAQATLYARIAGQLNPIVLERIATLWIHPGDAIFSANPHGIVIHTNYENQFFINQGLLEELMAHESVHAALDVLYLRSQAWFDAQKADVSFVTDYAREFPETEDLAESYGAYLIVKNADRNPPDMVSTIENGIPERLAFFESLGL
ncbi:MAG: hypothetical protein AAFQ90_03280 [Pseudomonadota bacterium]